MTSRLIVKGLPKHCSEQRLRQHLEPYRHLITDLKLLRTKNGKSRQFCFVGLKTPEAAEEVRKHYSRSFIDTSRISVEFAKPMGDNELPRPWSKYSKQKLEANNGQPPVNRGAQDSSAPTYNSEAKHDGRAAHASTESDPQMAEYLQLMRPNKSG